MAIHFENVSKAYDLHSGTRTLFSSLTAITGSAKDARLFYALKDVSFHIGRGEAFVIIGRNGAGMSTILKIIAGITKPTSGVVEVNGLVSSLIELGAGFHPDLTGRENIYLSGAILGISKKYIDTKFKEIVDFAELWDFIDVPVKKYSSGMYARLGFSVAVSVDPEILIIDEILSVGDIFFQQKCFTKMREIIHKGTTFIFVTHDTPALQNLCDRAILLEGGRVEYLGNTTEAVNKYYQKIGSRFGRGQQPTVEKSVENRGCSEGLMNRVEIIEHSILEDNNNRHGPRGLEIVAARVVDESGADTFEVPMLGKLFFHILLRANQDIPEPCAGMHLYDRMGNLVFAAGTPQRHYLLPSLAAGEELVLKFDLTLSVGPGEYTFSLLVSEPSAEGGPNIGYFHDQFDLLGPVRVLADFSTVLPYYGIAQLPMKISHGAVVKGVTVSTNGRFRQFS
ncbi:MAG: ABC transporter ATP-binding protein [Ignavibacteriae bacterium]|nr:ABC transporter ATP-binding protein [Ignavibacteriota bacterium]